MAMEIDDTFIDLDFSGHSTTTSATEDDRRGGGSWDDWSPVVDWDLLSGGSGDDFQHLFESIMEDSIEPHKCRHHSTATGSAASEDDEEISVVAGDSKGLRIINLLMAAAEALGGANRSRDLAGVILCRLKQLVSPNEGTNMERLAAYFSDALQNLLEGAGVVPANHLLAHGPHRDDHHHQMDVLAALQLLQDMSPYVKFGHFTANQAILEAVTHDRRIHIVDYDIMEGIQWASLMQSLVSRKNGPPAQHLRITAVSRTANARRSIGTVQETGRRLTAFAASIGQPFSFHQCRLDSDETFRPSSLKLVKGEALVVNCMLHLPHFSSRALESASSFLSGSKNLHPRLVTLVEEEVGPIGDGGFVGRFIDLLHHYSAMYDSLESGFPMQGRARALVEKVFLGPRIAGSLSRIYRQRGDEERSSCGERLAAAGFEPAAVSFANHCQAKLLLGLYNDGYKVEELANNRLVLGWKSRRLLSASIWTCSDPDFVN